MTLVPAPRGLRLPRSERRGQLLLAAQAVFVTAGYHSAAMDDIAHRAGVSKPVLYQHFPSKLDLYLALLDASSDALISAVRSALASTSDSRQRLAATVQTYFDCASDQLGTFRLVFESDLNAEPAVRERLDRVNNQCATIVGEVIADDTGLDNDAARLLAACLTGASLMAARWWSAQTGELTRATAEELISTLSWRGIGGFPRAADAADGVGVAVG